MRRFNIILLVLISQCSGAVNPRIVTALAKKASSASAITAESHKDILLKAYQTFHAVPGFQDVMKKIQQAEGHASQKGYAFELEAALMLEAESRRVHAFSQHLKSNKSKSREFDIVTEDVLYECKCIRWAESSRKILRQLKSQKAIAQSHNKAFILRSKHTIPDSWKVKLDELNIQYQEG